MKPGGVTLKHRDLMEVWKTMFRIHIPIYTNQDAVLISDGYAQHFSCGTAWSFDNYSDHGVVNGDTDRVHLILDVPFNPKLQQQIDQADIVQGEYSEKHLMVINDKSKSTPSYPGDKQVITGIEMLVRQGLSNHMIAQFLNDKKIPPKSATNNLWDENMVAAITKNQGS